MKGLSLTQPWASLVARGVKRVETRSWSTHYRGPLAIYAAKSFPPDCQAFAERCAILGLTPCALPLGAIVAIATLAGCRNTEDVRHQLSPLEHHLGDYADGRYAWFLTDIHVLESPIAARHVRADGSEQPGGALGLWRLPADLQQQLLALAAPVHA